MEVKKRRTAVCLADSVMVVVVVVVVVEGSGGGCEEWGTRTAWEDIWNWGLSGGSSRLVGWKQEGDQGG